MNNEQPELNRHDKKYLVVKKVQLFKMFLLWRHTNCQHLEPVKKSNQQKAYVTFEFISLFCAKFHVNRSSFFGMIQWQTNFITDALSV